MSDALPGPTSDFYDTVGAYTIALAFMYTLCGLSFGQYVHYFRHYQEDRAILKWLVTAAICLEIIHAVLVTDGVYTKVVINHADPAKIGNPTVSIAIHPASVSVTNLLIRSFFCYRIYQLSRSIYLPVALVIGSFAPLGVAIYDAVVVIEHSSWDNLGPTIYIAFSIDIALDIIVAVYLCIWLGIKSKSDYAVPASTNYILNTLMTYTIYTGLLTVIIYTASLVMYGLMPDNFIWQSIYLVTSQVFTNSMLAVLNARQSLRNKSTAEPTLSFPQSTGGGVQFRRDVTIELSEVR